MENASKALIIAGAILISILLISIGIIVMNSINDPIDQATDSSASQAIEMFNSKFTGYSGTQKASAVKSLITAINSSNGASPEHEITVAAGSIASTLAGIQSSVSSKETYVVTFDTDTNGYINTVQVVKK